MSVEIKSTVKGWPRGLPFSVMTEKVLGEKYELSLVFVGPEKMRALNNVYRGKDKVTDVLSFSLTENSGEIFICLSKVKSQAKKLGHPFEEYVAFLFIHGLHHLKGLDHGSRMDEEEKVARKLFGIEI